MKTTKTILITVIVAILLSLSPQNAFCGWRNNSSNLPGMTDGTPYVIAASVALTGLIVYLIIKKKKKKQGKITKGKSHSIQNDYEKLSARSLYDKIKNAGEQSKVELFVGSNSASEQVIYNANSRISVGLRLKF